ncbi:MAG: hypothetical protein H0T89_17205 [Deltaproteobacteria bacterium]|nr:hypothetical protein [Deltaproteobacteria bacterium]MDQ3294956.1 hypothetical protein [Myxococcota bacterium]
MTFKLAIVLLSTAVATVEAGPAKKPVNVLALTPASLSGSGPSLVKKVKAADAGRVLIYEQDGEWTVHYAIALASPLQVPELDLKISDVSRTKQTVGTRHKMVYSDAAVVRGSFKLTRDEVLSVNAKLLLEIASDGEPLAKRTFFIQSKSVSATGTRQIDFSADEASGSDTVNTETVATKRR